MKNRLKRLPRRTRTAASPLRPCLSCSATGRDFDRAGKLCERCAGRGWIVKVVNLFPALALN